MDSWILGSGTLDASCAYDRLTGSAHIVSGVRVELSEKVPQDQGFDPPGTHDDVFP